MTMDFGQHNAAVRQVWADYRAGRPSRVPMILGVSTRCFILDPSVNVDGPTFEQYMNDPYTMLLTQLKMHYWVRHYLFQDAEMGLPERGWNVSVDFQNFYEAVWLGCEVKYYPHEVPDSVPCLAGEGKDRFAGTKPDPFGSLMARNLEYYEFLCRQRAKGFTFMGRPIASVTPAAMGTDGPFTVACNLRGATELCTDIYDDPGFVHELLDFITDAIIDRITAWRRLLGQEVVQEVFGFADDSIQLLSCDTYEKFVLPRHRRLVAAFSSGKSNGIHLCGDASRHFRVIRDELSVTSFDTGFPIDLARTRRELGPSVELKGGVKVELLRKGPVEAIEDEVRRILGSEVVEGGRFVLREANNLAPFTPTSHIRAMYEAAERYGRNMD